MRAVVLLLFLTACTGTPITICPPIVPYTKADQQAASAELDTLPKPSTLGRFMTDYGRLRDVLRACQ